MPAEDRIPGSSRAVAGQAGPRIAIVGPDFGFPNGTGAVSRVRCYASGLVACGARPVVLIVGASAPDQSNSGNTVAAGEWNGVPFEYATGTTLSAPGFIGRRIQELRALRRLASVVLGNRDRPDAVLLYGTVPRWGLPLRILCSVAHIPLIQDISEFPGVDYPHRGRLRVAAHLLRLRANLWLPDGFVVITTFLHEHLRPRVRRAAWMITVPIMVEGSRFNTAAERVPGLVSYAGNFGHLEELEDLVTAAALAARRVPSLHVEIIGAASPGQRDSVERIVRAAGMEGRVALPGPVQAEDIPARLSRASALVLARADGLFSRAGMPTKLGEYLATGRPVVVTSTGDIPRYLHDGVDSFLVPPRDVSALADGMVRALTDERAAEIGLAGRDVALRSFDPAPHMRRLIGEITRP